MGLKEVLEKMKIVESEGDADLASPSAASRPAASAPPRPASAPGARPSMQDVLGSVPPRPKLDEAALAATARSAGADVPDFEAIYKAAGVKDPAHGFTAYKVLEIFSSPEFSKLDVASKAAALGGFLKMNPSGPVPIAHVIQDAVTRDQALDGFEDFLRKKLDARREDLDKENAKLQAEIDEVTRKNREKMDQNAATLAGERERLAAWQTKKRIEERKLFDAVAPFVEENPVSIGDQSPAPGVPPSVKS